jgi:hypothetical protein
LLLPSNSTPTATAATIATAIAAIHRQRRLPRFMVLLLLQIDGLAA